MRLTKRAGLMVLATVVVAPFLVAPFGCSTDPGVGVNGSNDGGGGGARTGGGGTGGGLSVPSGGGGTGTGTGTGATTGTGTGGVTGTPSASGGTGGCGVDPSACKADQYRAENVPLDIYVMFDQSGSMAIKDDGKLMRMDAVRSAVEQFLAAPENNGVRIGIGYFGTQPLECACTSCNAMDYAAAAVPMGALPGHASAIMASLKGIMPTGETPTGAAIRGACTYAKGWRQSNPGRQVAILLVTDGEPQAPLTSMKGGCNPTLEDAQAAANDCRGGVDGLRTYVLGIGPSLQNLDKIAASGGTSKAYLVANGGTTDIVKALRAIRGDATIPCFVKIPQPTTGRVDFGKVNVVYRDAACAPTTLVNVGTASACNAQSGGWYYDNPNAPSTIQLCGASCDRVKAPGSELNVTVGCNTRLIE